MKLYNYCWSKVQEVKGYLKDRKGQGLVEYILIIAGVAILVAAVFTTGLGTIIQTKFQTILNSL